MQDYYSQQEEGHDPPWIVGMNQCTQNGCQARQIRRRADPNQAIKEFNVPPSSHCCHKLFASWSGNASTKKIAVMIMIFNTSLTNITMKVFDATGVGLCSSSSWCCCWVSYCLFGSLGSATHSPPYQTPCTICIMRSMFVLWGNIQYGWTILLIIITTVGGAG